MKKIALLPGGFKPPHAGHYNMAKWLSINTGADKTIIFIGPKERDGITQEMSLELWKLYIQNDPKLEIRKAGVSPVRDVYDFIEQEAPIGSTVFLGMGEKDISDKRFANIPKFAEPRGITFKTELVPPQAGGVSGTEMRGFIRNDQETLFYNSLPDHVSEKDKQDAWSIVTKSQENPLNENLDEGIRDFIKTNKDKLQNLLKNFKEAWNDQKGSFKGYKGLVQKFLNDRNSLDIEEKAKLKQNTKDLFKTAGIIITFPVLGVTGNVLLAFLVDKISKGQFSNLPSQMANVVGEDLYDPNDHVSDYMKSSEYKAGMPDGPKKDITPSYKYKRGGLYGKMYNETVTDTDIICDNCGWTWAIVDGGDDLYICHTCGHDNTPNKMNEQKLFSKNWWKSIINETLLTEGGAAGHMAHPFDLPNVTSGRDLVNVFEQAANSLQTNPGAVKIDGVNSSIRLIDVGGTKQFAMDRGSKKDLDIKGITKADLEDRFSQGHGMIKVGGEVLDMFNEALPSIQGDLKKLGALDDPSILFNMEYVSGKTNVQDYGSNFIAIHGLNKVKMEEVPGRMYRGKPLVKRYSQEFNYDKNALQSLLNNLAPIAKKRGFEVYGSVPTEMTTKPNFRSALSKRYTVETNEGAQVKPLGQWLEGMNNIPVSDFIFMNVGGGKKKVGAVSKQVYLAILKGGNVDELFEDQDDKQKAINGFATYLGTEKLGDEVLKVLDSPMGSVENHEGVVIRDEKIAKIPFKITGKFILGGMVSDF